MDWDLVFNTGWHTDSEGNRKLWTREDLDRIVSTFKPSFHEPPLVIGHPSNNAPAFGWVEGIKREGEALYLKYKQVADEFKEWNKKGLFKKKSIAVYPDGSLRHIGYLGAAPPAIKGLPDYAFNDSARGAAVTWEFCDMDDMTVAGLFRNLRDWIIGKFGKDEADKILPDYQVAGLQISACMPEPDEVPGQMINDNKEDEMDAKAVEAIVTKAVTAVTASFSEQLKTFGEENKTLRTEIESLRKGLATSQDAQDRAGFLAFCETPEMKKRLTPAAASAAVAYMMTLRGAEPQEFDDGQGGKCKRTQIELYQEQLGALPETVQFGEFATGDRAGQREVGGEDAAALARKAQEFQETEAKAGRTVTIADAVTHVQREAAKGGATK